MSGQTADAKTGQKRPGLAFLLSFILPGAGFVYLGKWKYGLINLAIVLLIGIIATVVLSEEVLDKYARYIALGCSGGSAGLAREMAKTWNCRTTAT